MNATNRLDHRHLGGDLTGVLAVLDTFVAIASPVPAVASPMRSVHAAAVTGAIAQLGKPRSTNHGFTVNVTNSSEEYVWSVKTVRDKVAKGEANGTTLPITVTGLQQGESASVEVTAEMPGLELSSATVTGTAAASTAGQTTEMGRATERFTFAGQTARISCDGNLLLQRLVAWIPASHCRRASQSQSPSR
jgi:hypothetical protein